MTIAEHTLSHLLRNSGAVVREAEVRDVRIVRRDGSDLFVGTARREDAVRDSLDIATRALGVVLTTPELEDEALAGIVQALPWTGWLPPDDLREFAVEFVNTASACHDTANYEPLTRLLARWKASAQIANDPDLAEALRADRGEDEVVVLARPNS